MRVAAGMMAGPSPVQGHDSMTQRKHRTVLFLCMGNYYRSRFAEILFNSVAVKMGLR
jgi:hypothetical protein